MVSKGLTLMSPESLKERKKEISTGEKKLKKLRLKMS